ncbi:potassium channel family protein [Mangrovivirga sp. M17]|uniref:Potassium channel family protein n=1 Tax=Mangrovivirga halotolerans TaxID=2993936 RepID=A0ABT3RQ41_9BACT|nr:potassium channel family protein [Mangrovivirga halotolerans]
MAKKYKISLWVNVLLAITLFFTIFVVNLLPVEFKRGTYGISYAFIILFCSYVVSHKTNEIHKAKKSKVFVVGLTLFILRIGGSLIPESLFFKIVSVAELFFFIYIVFRLIIIIAAARKVTPSVIFEAINGYLLLGIVISLLIGIGYLYDNNSFNFSVNQTILDDDIGSKTGMFLYYGFITLTTVGYGDLVPSSNFGRSIAIFTGVAGQLYLTVILAFLIGKLSSPKRPSKND